MCKLSSRLKLCTCAGDVNYDGNYWIFLRFDPIRREIIMGEPMMPDFIDPAVVDFNRDLLLSQLSEGNAFDIELKPKNKDRLLISLAVGDDKRINYGFAYEQKRWVYSEYDPFEWRWKHVEEKLGEVRDAMQ